MADVEFILFFFQIGLFAIIILLALTYLIPILLFRQFRHRLNIFTVNVSMAVLCCSLYWFVYYFLQQFDVQELFSLKNCYLVFYTQAMFTVQIPLALAVVSIHRLCLVVYSRKIFFQQRKWMIMCVTCQWLVGIVIALPLLRRDTSVRI